MLPENRLSTVAIPSTFLGGRSLTTSKILDWETGGIGIGDPSQGLQVQTWRGRLVGNDIILDVPDNPGVTPYTVYSGAGITEFSFSFNQLMSPLVIFVQSDSVKMYWYDSTVSNYVVTDYGNLLSHPKLALDDKRKTQTGNSDIIFAYIKDSSLYFRMQRERFLVPHLLKTNETYLHSIGMAVNNRFLFRTT
jgi:hypothetical protein